MFFKGEKFVDLDVNYLLIVCYGIVYFIVIWCDVFILFFFNYKNFFIVDEGKCIRLRLVYGFYV